MRDGAVDREDLADHLGLVHMWVSRALRPGLERADLVQEGATGLMLAARRFDPSRGIAFSTYASYWIRKAIQTGAARAHDRLGVGIDRESERRAVDAVVSEELARSGTPPSLGRLAELTGYSEQRVRSILDEPKFEPGGLSSLRDEPPDAQQSARLEAVLAHVAVEKAVGSLESPMREVIRLRYGLGGLPLTCKCVAGRLGLPVRRVTQLTQEALSILESRLDDRD